MNKLITYIKNVIFLKLYLKANFFSNGKLIKIFIYLVSLFFIFF